ncbi:MAG: hypothetical protein ACPLXC_01390 [Candidatus Pacearchaeota archaeon]
MANNLFVNNPKSKNKRGISELISYVLLITLALAMAAAFWFFIRPYIERPLPEEECPESVSIVLENYSCNGTHINYTLKNRGLHNIEGVKLNVIDPILNNEFTLQWFLPSPACQQIQETCTECDNVCLRAGETPLQGETNYQRFVEIKKIAIYPIKTDEKGIAKICTGAVLKIPITNCRSRTPPE